MARNTLVGLDELQGRYLIKEATLGTIARESK